MGKERIYFGIAVKRFPGLQHVSVKQAYLSWQSVWKINQWNVHRGSVFISRRQHITPDVRIVSTEQTGCLIFYSVEMPVQRHVTHSLMDTTTHASILSISLTSHLSAWWQQYRQPHPACATLGNIIRHNTTWSAHISITIIDCFINKIKCLVVWWKNYRCQKERLNRKAYVIVYK